ncbi:TPA: holin family protein [Listeria monocytogenes]|uniref:phage holin family protein n=1 Tax=Listeria monocytogenes TaxID=1639 RepID=UPI0009854892|nr:holin family protein [Listeria monocytogenes]EAD1624751.1 holin family protein [Listeria monocytogenes]EAE8754232.1 holin family protein [Listeria monocytogenes]HBI6831273.1 holin family protein [Listeria monocytogenes]HDB5194151.1 holin family protein [Listeria monocytogenes]
MEVILKIGILGFGAIFGYLFGEVDLLVKVLVCFIVADYISGLLASGYLGELSSKMGFKGIAKKIAILILVAIAHQIDLILGTHNTTRDAVIFFYLANELISILENFVRMGMKVPEVLKNLILIFDAKSGEGEGKHDKDMD